MPALTGIPFVERECFHIHSVDSAFSYFVAEHTINQLLALESPQTVKLGANQNQVKMPAVALHCHLTIRQAFFQQGFEIIWIHGVFTLALIICPIVDDFIQVTVIFFHRLHELVSECAAEINPVNNDIQHLPFTATVKPHTVE